MVELKNISKSYNKGEIQAVKDVSFSINKGEIFGLIGPDGAGKTSIFRMLTTLLIPDTGSATVDGFDIVKDYKDIRKTVGYMPGKISLYQDLTVKENLNFFATVFNTTIEENYDLIKDIYEQISPFNDRRAGALSGGMKQKLALCCALIHEPTVLFLDEPTTGVDVVSRKEFWEMLQKLKKRGIGILVSTPYMDEANQCDRIALIQNGEIMSVNTPDNIVKSFPKKLYAARANEIYQLIKEFESDEEIESSYPFGEYIHFTVKTDQDLNTIRKSFSERHPLEGLEIIESTPTIEDSFIRLMRESETKLKDDGE